MEIDPSQAMEFALSTAKEGAELAMEYRNKMDSSGFTLEIENKSPRDFVTEADLAVQKLITDKIQSEYSEHRIIAEEKGADSLGNPDCEFAWVLDPIDGTKPFMNGRCEFGVILGLMKNNEVILGVMVLPKQEEVFRCIKGQGVFYNDRPVVLKKTTEMNEAMVCCNIRGRERIIDDVPHVPVPLCGSLENYGCAADEIGKILKGQNDGTFFHGPRIWDIAVGYMMVEEAGGKAEWRLDDPDDFRSAVRGCCACTKELFEQLREFTFEKIKDFELRNS